MPDHSPVGLERWVFADGSLLLASGGDDNALTVHRLSLTRAATGPGSTDGSQDTGAGSGTTLTSSSSSTVTGVESADAECHRQHGLLEVVSVVTKTDAHAAQITGTFQLGPGGVL